MDKFSETYKLSKPLQEVDNLNRPKRSKGIVLVFSSVSHSVMSDSPCPQTVAHQPPLSMEFSKQEYWSWLPCPPPGDLPDPGIKWGLLHCIGEINDSNCIMTQVSNNVLD